MSQPAMTQEAAPCALAASSNGTFPLVDRLRCYLALSNPELDFLHALHEPRRKFGRHRDVVVAGKQYNHLFILCDGLVSRYKVLPDGRRQVLNLGLPGDLIGFPSTLFQVAVNSVSSLTDIVVSPVPFTHLISLFSQLPHIGAAQCWSSACEVAMCGEHHVNLGRRTAYERLAHLILELLVRLRAVGVAGELSYTLPLTQELMADVLGLSGPPRQSYDQMPPGGRSCYDRRSARRHS